MKIAITSTGNTLDSLIDSRFGRCSYFVIYDSETKSTEFIPNPNKESIEGAGPASAQLIATKGVTKVVSGEFGAKVKSLFDTLQIELVILNKADKSIKEIIELLER
jgi:predicted Fe-Mo cluster-binding NifX family protein